MKPPAKLVGKRRREWRLVYDALQAELVEAGKAEAPPEVAASYAEAVIAHREASEAIAEHGRVLVDQSGKLVRNPYCAEQAEAVKTILAIRQSLGLSVAGTTQYLGVKAQRQRAANALEKTHSIFAPIDPPQALQKRVQ